MSIRKRVLALAAAGATALILGGALNLTQHAARVDASPPTQAVLGCANSTLPTDIRFSTNLNGTIVGGAQLPNATTPATLNAFYPTGAPLGFGVVECGAAFEDGTVALAAVVGPPALPASDADPSTIDSGTITFTLTGGAGIAQINEGNGPVAVIPCGGTTAEGCQGAQLFAAPPAVGTPGVGSSACSAAATCTVATPSNSNVVHVSLKVGATFTFIGSAQPNVLITAMFNQSPSVAANPAGSATTVSTNAVSIGFAVPTYLISLTAVPPNPANIPANGTIGSTITATLLHQSFLTPGQCGVIFGTLNCNVAGQFAFVPGAEPGVVTFTTTNGYFAPSSAIPGSTGQQVFSTHCGQIPGASPILIVPPLASQGGVFALNQCQSATVQLLGGGNVGPAYVSGSFVGDITGATSNYVNPTLAQSTVLVQITPTPPTQNLSRGCNEVITPANTVVGASFASIAALVNPTAAVVSIWEFNNALHAFQAGLFATAGAPVDILGGVGPNVSVFICVSSAATFTAVPY